MYVAGWVLLLGGLLGQLAQALAIGLLLIIATLLLAMAAAVWEEYNAE